MLATIGVREDGAVLGSILSAGESVGVFEGAVVGSSATDLVVGPVVEATDGASVSVGITEGTKLGDVDGAAVNASEGSVGSMDAATLGAPSRVGTTAGASDGAADSSDGAVVGTADGSVDSLEGINEGLQEGSSDVVGCVVWLGVADGCTVVGTVEGV